MASSSVFMKQEGMHVKKLISHKRFMIHFCATHKLQTKPMWNFYLSIIHMNNHIAHLSYGTIGFDNSRFRFGFELITNTLGSLHVRFNISCVGYYLKLKT